MVPVYTYLILVRPHVPRFIPKILHRLVLGLALTVVTTALMFGILTIAKSQAIHRPDYDGTMSPYIFVAEPQLGIPNSSFS